MLVSPRGSAQSRRLGRQPGTALRLPVTVQMGLEFQQELQQGRCRQGAEVNSLRHLEPAFVGGGRLAQKEDIQKEDLFIFWTSQEMRRVSRPAWRESRRDGLAPLHGPQPLRDNAGRTVPLLNQAWPALRLGVHPGAEGGSRPKQKTDTTLRHCSEEVHRSPKERN